MDSTRQGFGIPGAISWVPGWEMMIVMTDSAVGDFEGTGPSPSLLVLHRKGNAETTGDVLVSLDSGLLGFLGRKRYMNLYTPLPAAYVCSHVRKSHHPSYTPAACASLDVLTQETN